MSRNARLLAARRWMHDRVCTSGPECVSRDDHARRTQHDFARAVVDAPEAEYAELIHDHACYAHKMRADGCADRDRHVETAATTAASLREALASAGG